MNAMYDKYASIGLLSDITKMMVDYLAEQITECVRRKQISELN
jgi:hypothetical protein